MPMPMPMPMPMSTATATPMATETRGAHTTSPHHLLGVSTARDGCLSTTTSELFTISLPRAFLIHSAKTAAARKQPLLQDHAAVIPSAARSRKVSSPPQVYQAETLDETVRCTAISLSVSCPCSPAPGPGAHEEA
ncbi:hypothetical protein HYQ45_000509 [Verticillium longisporum]|uniref:Uncharacterized protein n=1 Tax=Verticillium longisporum TaxID=100787 RepID=A0A8I3AXI8_VERLO|nr:hypothetical protein HYQ45_000509 [Verticillium longisporum]